MEPRHWSAAVWRTVHAVAHAYPADGTADALSKAACRNFFVSLGVVLPCERCARGYGRMMADWGAAALDRALDDGKLFEWSVRVHNHVNRKLQRRQWTIEQARTALLSEQPMHAKDSSPRRNDGPMPPVWYPVLVMSISLCVGFLMAALAACIAWHTWRGARALSRGIGGLGLLRSIYIRRQV